MGVVPCVLTLKLSVIGVVDEGSDGVLTTIVRAWVNFAPSVKLAGVTEAMFQPDGVLAKLGVLTVKVPTRSPVLVTMWLNVTVVPARCWVKGPETAGMAGLIVPIVVVSVTVLEPTRPANARTIVTSVALAEDGTATVTTKSVELVKPLAAAGTITWNGAEAHCGVFVELSTMV